MNLSELKEKKLKKMLTLQSTILQAKNPLIKLYNISKVVLKVPSLISKETIITTPIMQKSRSLKLFHKSRKLIQIHKSKRRGSLAY